MSYKEINIIEDLIVQVFYDKMKDSQQEIKSTVTVNTSDMAAKAHEDKEQGKELEKMGRKKGGTYLPGAVIFNKN